MGNDSNSYRTIIKGASVFGSIQTLQILVALVRGKFVASILGPEGMGISAMFTSAANSIQQISSLGLNLAIVKEVAADNSATKDIVFSVARRLLLLTATLGALVCILFCIPLSRLSFGSDSYAVQFMLLGVAVWLAVENAGRLSMLQGLRKIKDISRASLYGALVGLFGGVPLYYFLGNAGIVPAIVAVNLSLFIFYTVALRKCCPENSQANSKTSWRPLAKKLVWLGLILVANDLAANLVAYILNIFIRANGSEYELGLYQASNSITMQFSGVVFAALVMDYFPRLSKVAADNRAVSDAVSRQTEIASLLMAPAVALLILFSPVVITILLAPEFSQIVSLLRWMALGMVFRAMMLPMGYISFAKGNRRVFFGLEVVFCNLLTLSLSTIFFKLYGLSGLGYAIVADNAICLVVYYIVNRRLYRLRLSANALRDMGVAVLIGVSALASSFLSIPAVSCTLMAATALLSILYSILRLRRLLRHHRL